MKKKVLAVLCAVVVGISSLAVSASAAATWVEASAEAIATAIWELSKASMQISLEQFLYIVENNWIYNAVDYTLTDPDTGITYGFEQYYNDDGSVGAVGLSRSGRSGGSQGRVRVDTASDVEIGGKTFSEILAQLQEQYGPGNSEGRLSWLEGDAYHPYNNYNLGFFTVLQLGNYIDSSNGKSVGVYLQPYYYDGTEFFYSDKIWHLYADTKDGDDTVYYYLDIYNTDYQLLVSNKLKNHDIVKHKYFMICPFGNATGSKTGMGRSYVDEASWKNCPNINSSLYYSASVFGLSTDSFRFFDVNYQEHIFDKSVFEFSGGYPSSSDVTDCGFYWSNEPLEMGFFKDIIPEKIPDNYIITFGGDTIYNYTITDPDTGEGNTINEYITNNYTINNYYGDGETGESGSSGGTTGDITVGGNIGVNGQVDVNFNLNVNTGSGGGSGGTAEVDPYDYEKVNLDEALEQIPEMGDGFTAWFSKVFDFLPPELMGLLIGGITLAILLRIAGR